MRFCRNIPPQDMKHRRDNQASQFKRIHQLGDDLINNSKVNDSSFVATVMANLDDNYNDFEDALQQR